MSESTRLGLQTIYAKKAGMTRIFDESGNHVPVTVVQLIPNFISQVKTSEKDGYEAYQLAFQEKREKLVTKPVKGHLAKAGIKTPVYKFSEVRCEGVSEENVGKSISLEQFEKEMFVDVTGVSKGKGFAGAMKRHNFQGGPAAHGSKFHRRTGSIGNRATPGRVFPQKKMPGHMGVETKTIQNLQVVEVNEEQGYMLIKGSLPGAKNSFVRISKALKK